MFVEFEYFSLYLYRYDISKLVDLSELTWEQKEQVLRELFARINGAKLNREQQKSKLNKNQSLAIDKFSKNTLDKYETDDEEQEFSMPKPISFSTKALANAM